MAITVESVPQPRFPLGQTVITRCALIACLATDADPMELLDRHVSGDWGQLSADDRQANEDAVAHGERVFSSYPIGENAKLWIITEWNRSLTTILLPSEY